MCNKPKYIMAKHFQRKPGGDQLQIWNKRIIGVQYSTNLYDTSLEFAVIHFSSSSSWLTSSFKNIPGLFQVP